MPTFLPFLITLPFLAFWAWMFYDMANNDDLPSQSNPPLTWPPQSKASWAIIFVFLNVVGAAFYYLTVFQEK